MRKRMRLYGVRKKLIWYMTLLLMGTIMTICICTELIVSKNERASTLSRYSSITENVYYAFDKLYGELDVITEQVIMDPYVQKSLTRQPLDSYESEMLKNALTLINDKVLSYYLYMDNKGHLYSQRTVGQKASDIYNSSLYTGLGEDYSVTKLHWADDTIFGDGEKAMFVGRYVRNMDILAQPGVVYFRLQDDFFSQLLSKMQDTTPIYMLISDQNEICVHSSHNDEEVWDEEMQKSILEELDSNGASAEEGFYTYIKGGLLCARKHAESGFTIAVFVPASKLAKLSREIIAAIILIAVLAFIPAVLISVYLSERISKPIQYISDRMKHFNRESLSEQIVVHTDTELDDIGNSYNKMLELIESLIQEVRHTEQELRESEMKSLLYQIHPHFLYNTLDTIYMLARINKEPVIMKMIQSLTTYLRVTLSNGREEITIKEELSHVAAYMEIQKIRKDDLFTYQIQCEKDIESLRIIKLILQPIVENSIKHGFAEIEEGGQISISVWKKEDKVVFEVRNNDRLDEEKLLWMNHIEERAGHEVQTNENGHKGGYGIRNVIRRLKLKYGENSRLFYRTDDGWVICCIEIPYMPERGEIM